MIVSLKIFPYLSPTFVSVINTISISGLVGVSTISAIYVMSKDGHQLKTSIEKVIESFSIFNKLGIIAPAFTGIIPLYTKINEWFSKIPFNSLEKTKEFEIKKIYRGLLKIYSQLGLWINQKDAILEFIKRAHEQESKITWEQVKNLINSAKQISPGIGKIFETFGGQFWQLFEKFVLSKPNSNGEIRLEKLFSLFTKAIQNPDFFRAFSPMADLFSQNLDLLKNLNENEMFEVMEFMMQHPDKFIQVAEYLKNSGQINKFKNMQELVTSFKNQNAIGLAVTGIMSEITKFFCNNEREGLCNATIYGDAAGNAWNMISSFFNSRIQTLWL